MNESIIIGSQEPTRRGRSGGWVLLLALVAAGLATWFAASRDPQTAPLPVLPIATTTPAAPLVSSVKVAFLDASGETKGPQSGCDTVAIIEVPVAPTPAPLSAALKALFAEATTTDLVPGNYVAESQKTLKFDHVTYVDTVASVYLTGELSPLGGECDDPRLQGQIEETVKANAPAASKTQIYINGKAYEMPNEKGV